MTARANRFAEALNRLVAVAPGDDELLMLVRLGVQFKRQHTGGHPGFLRKYIEGIVSRMDKPTFANLLNILATRAARRELRGELASPIEKVDRIRQVMTYHHPRAGRKQIEFASLRNVLTTAKKFIPGANQ